MKTAETPRPGSPPCKRKTIMPSALNVVILAGLVALLTPAAGSAQTLETETARPFAEAFSNSVGTLNINGPARAMSPRCRC